MSLEKVIFPPRPKGAVPPTELNRLEKTNAWAVQYKYNGARNVIHITADGQVAVWGRHGAAHKVYDLPAGVRAELLALPGLEKGKEYWLDSELLVKTSASDTKGKIVLFDVLQAGRYLFSGPNQMARLAMLSAICGHPTQLDPLRQMGFVVSDNVLMAPTFVNNFLTLFKEDHGAEVEGLVLRRRDSTLDNFGLKEYEVGWLVRCRKLHKNYNF